MKYYQINERYTTLKKLGNKILPRKVSYAISRNIMLLEEELKLYIQQRKDIADRYAMKDENREYILDGDSYSFATMNDQELFIAENHELVGTEVEVNIVKFHVNELDKCEENQRYDLLTPLEETSISWMIEYDENEKAASC